MYSILYDERVAADVAKLSTTTHKRLQAAITSKLSERPELFGKPLRHSLLGFRRLRVGEYRVVYLIREDTVYVLLIAHRKDVYERAKRRLGT